MRATPVRIGLYVTNFPADAVRGDERGGGERMHIRDSYSLFVRGGSVSRKACGGVRERSVAVPTSEMELHAQADLAGRHDVGDVAERRS